MSYTVTTAASAVGVHVYVSPKPPSGTVIRYTLTVSGGTISPYLDSGGGTQNYVYVSIASGTGGSSTHYADVSKATSMVLYFEASSWAARSDGTYESGDALYVLSSGATVTARAKLLLPSS